jgi:AraC-like DNA-binding protein
MKLYIKFMVSQRCKLLVISELEKLNLRWTTVDLGMVELPLDLTESEREELNKKLLRSGLELLDDKKSILIEKVKTLIIEMIHFVDNDETSKKNFSHLLTEKTGYDYTYVSNMFSTVKGTTIEQYIIFNRIERAKELILYDELNLSEIANKLNYRSVSHLSSQFKKITGLTPSYFKLLAENKKRIALEDL